MAGVVDARRHLIDVENFASHKIEREEFNRKYANKLMQLRILAQGLAVVAIVIFAWARSKGAP